MIQSSNIFDLYHLNNDYHLTNNLNTDSMFIVYLFFTFNNLIGDSKMKKIITAVICSVTIAATPIAAMAQSIGNHVDCVVTTEKERAKIVDTGDTVKSFDEVIECTAKRNVNILQQYQATKEVAKDHETTDKLQIGLGGQEVKQVQKNKYRVENKNEIREITISKNGRKLQDKVTYKIAP